MSQETVRLSNNFVRERHDSYKTLVGHVAEQLSEEDLRNIFWYVDAPEKLRTGPALDVLESMKRQGKFSEFNVQFLSDLLKKISRIDLMDKVDLYSQQYARHYSLPPGHVYPPPMTPAQRSYSVGSQQCDKSFPYQETIHKETSHGAEPPLQQVHPTPDAQMLTKRATSVMNGLNYSSQIPHSHLVQSTSLETMPHSRLSNRMCSPNSAVGHQSSNCPDNISPSNSGSIHFIYTSHPSSLNTSQDSFHPEPAHMSKMTGEMAYYGDPVSNFNTAPPFEYYNIPRPPPLYSSHLAYPWYRQPSLSSIPQCMNYPSFDPRSIQNQHYQFHHSTTEVASNSNSQDSLSSGRGYMHHLPLQQVQYYTPPYDRRNPVMSRSGYQRVPPRRNQSICGYPNTTDRWYHSQPFFPPGFLKESGPPANGAEVKRTRYKDTPAPAAENIIEQTILENKEVAVAKNRMNNQSPEYSTSSPHEHGSNSMLMGKDEKECNGTNEVVTRKRANSLFHDDRKTPSMRNKNRLSFHSVDEKVPHREHKQEFEQLQSNAIQRSVSANATNFTVTGSVNLAEGPLSPISKHSGSKGSVVHSSSTINSDDYQNNGASSSSKSRGVSTNAKPHRSKETLLSKLTQQFSKIVRPHKEIEWMIKRSKVNKVVYEQTDKFLTCPYRLELDGGLGSSNPKLTLYVHPYGLEEDSNESVTCEVRIEMPSRPCVQRLHSQAEVEVNIKAETKEKKEVLGRQRVVRESVRLNYFFVKGFISHQSLKQSHSDYIIITVSANLISPV